MSKKLNLEFNVLRAQYLSGELTPETLVNQLHAAIKQEDANPIWIRRLSLEEMLVYATKLKGIEPASLPLYGIPFAIKDNIDLKGVPTTAACPDFSYLPEKSATVVQKLIDAGAIPVGKTNLDQFATGLVGTRSPHGACKNSVDPTYISGGSSSGSAVSVALGMVSFSLGTDTAGSGRVPAAFNNLIGLKPTCGLLSTSGVVPACRSLDCVSIFAINAIDASTVLDVAQGFDSEDPYSRKKHSDNLIASNFSFGVPQDNQLEFFGNSETQQLFIDAVKRMESIGGKKVVIDFDPFLETARLLYEGPWVAERYAAIKTFIETKPESMFPVTKQIISGATRFTAVDAYIAEYRLKALQRVNEPIWNDIDVLLTPTAGTIYTIKEVELDPVKTNSNLGYYTNFLNLLDLSAIPVPAGFQSNKLPFGVTLAAPAFSDKGLIDLGHRLHAALNQ